MRNMNAIDAKLEQLSATVRQFRSALVCYSGGVDSAFVLAIATRELGDRAVAMTAVSPSLPPGELDDPERLAPEIGAAHRLLASNEIADPKHLPNQPATP